MDEGISALERRYLSLIVIDADNGMAHFGETDGGDEADDSAPGSGAVYVFGELGRVAF